MIGVVEFLTRVRQIAAERPTYRLGGSGEGYNAATGARGTCDCIGLVIGALRRAGEGWTGIHGTNLAARYEIAGGLQAVSAAVLLPGMVVFKSRDSTAKLSPRYLAGGSMATGDLRDYYHIGVVLRVSPLQIVHCTTGGGMSGIVYDTKLGAWAWAGKLRRVAYGTETAEKAGGASMEEICIVSTGNGPLNMRAGASRKEKIVNRIPDGDEVTALSTTGDWAKVRWGSKVGYVMREFLIVKRLTGAVPTGSGDAAPPDAASDSDAAEQPDASEMNARLDALSAALSTALEALIAKQDVITESVLRNEELLRRLVEVFGAEQVTPEDAGSDAGSEAGPAEEEPPAIEPVPEDVELPYTEPPDLSGEGVNEETVEE